LVLPDRDTMTPVLLRKIRDLAKGGATVYGPKPSKSPSLQDYPKCDDEARALAEEMWGPSTPLGAGPSTGLGAGPSTGLKAGEQAAERKFGKGKVVWGMPMQELLVSLGAKPDFECAAPGIHWIHRRVGEADVYFVANADEASRDVLCTFRVAGKVPELWFPDTGRMETLAVYDEIDGRTRVPIRFDPCGSVFVVFRAAPKQERVVDVAMRGKSLLPQEPAAGDSKAGAPVAAADDNAGVVDTFTMACWIKPGKDTPLPKEANQGVEGRGQNWALYPPPGHTLYGEGHAGAGIAAGRNGICVFEHSASYQPALLVHKAPVADWTHVAVVYQDKQPSLYVNGQFAAKGLKSKKTVHSGVGVQHERKAAPFAGQAAELQQFDRVLSAEEIAELAAKGRPETGAGGAEGASVPALELTQGRRGAIEARAWQAGAYELKTSKGKTLKLDVAALPEPVEIAGPWDVRFPPNWGAPDRIVLDKLISWTQREEAGVKYFSGTATYAKELDVPAEMLGEGKEVWLDFGAVKCFAEPALNGQAFGVLWKPPFRVNIAGAAKTGKNELEVRVTNLWPNRLIGDQFLPEDQRYTWTTWKHYTKDSPLLESGLLGPVTLRAAERREVPLAGNRR
ncbi:MAG: glycosyl hydrolase, partial [Candidatus Sumerlaeota bacterium]|nr:glycosyl hydrolase [Candidatus Sumerlaeota bacterium]